MKSFPSHMDLRRLRNGTIPASAFWPILALCFALLICRAAGGVVINEIMYHPPNDFEDLQYIELFNSDSKEADLGGWSFSKGVKFSFPKGTKLAAGGYLVVCRSQSKFAERYGNSIQVAGEFNGHLSHDGERVELSDDDQALIDVVKYGDSAPWPKSADGRSCSLERICPGGSGEEPSNWSASKLPELITPGGTPGKVNDSFSANPVSYTHLTLPTKRIV